MKVYYPDAEDELIPERAVLGAALVSGRPDLDRVEVLVVHRTPVTSDLLACLPRLRGVVRLGVGYDQVDLGACARRQVAVAHVPDYCTTEVADTALAMILNLVRGIQELESALRQQPEFWQSLSRPQIRRSSSLVLGVLGAGRIGRAVLERATPFGFGRLFYDPVVFSAAGAQRTENTVALLRQADIVSLHVPLQADTRGMVDRTFLAQMKPGSMLINTARGGLIGDEAALLESLLSGRLAGAALDVLPVEPPAAEPLFRAWQQDSDLAGRLILNPHNAYYSREASAEVRQLAAAEAARILAGEAFLHPVPAPVP
jgi:phosphoglycerate dehydrogenase-like enzyme